MTVKIREYHVPEEARGRWAWKSPNGVTKTEIDILTNRPDIVTDVTVNIGSDHRLVRRNIKLDVEMERKKSMTKRLPRGDAKRMGSKKIEFQLELRNRCETLRDLLHLYYPRVCSMSNPEKWSHLIVWHGKLMLYPSHQSLT